MTKENLFWGLLFPVIEASMSVKVNIDAQFLLIEQDHPDGTTFEAKGKTVGECLKQYLAIRPHLEKEFFIKWGRLATNFYIFINKQAVTPDHLEKGVKDGDEVEVMYTRMHGCRY
jgi:molybdopterin converting factor small subunit